MRRKGNPISVRLDPNRCSDSSRFSEKFPYVFFRALGSVSAIFFFSFLGSEGAALTREPKIFFLLLVVLVFLILILRTRLPFSPFSKKGKRVLLLTLFVLIYFLIGLVSHLLRFYLLGGTLAFFGLTTAFFFSVPYQEDAEPQSSGSSDSLPSSSDSESLGTFRQVILAENENELYRRIRLLEQRNLYSLPPQNFEGEYEGIVREHFDQALNTRDIRVIFDLEYQELQFLEKKALLQERLSHLLKTEPNFINIMDLSPYSDVSKEAYDFIEARVEPVSALSHRFQRDIMEGSLNSFIRELPADEGVARESELYREFYRHFSNEDFRRSLGLPLP